VNDFEIVTAGLRGMLEEYPTRVDVITLMDGLPDLTNADVILYDPFDGPGDERTGLETLVASVEAPVLIFTWHPLRELATLEKATGAAGRISKGASAEEILAAIEAAVAGEQVEPCECSRSGSSPHPLVDEKPALTPCEIQVLTLVAQGLLNTDIAETTFTSINTVKSHIRSAYDKIGVSRRPQAVAWALEHGLQAINDPDRTLAASETDPTGPLAVEPSP
jgi:DNA-binding NarL/FixJ family response regulator